MFMNFHLLELCDNSIVFLNMSWSTLREENNRISLITFGARLDFQKLLQKQQKVSWIQPLTEFSFQFRIPYFGGLYLRSHAEPAQDPLSKVVDLVVLFNFGYYSLRHN